MTVDDYSKWRSISGQVLSADGKWLAYILELTNVLPAETKPVLHIVHLGTNADVAVDDATAPVFSPDSRWIVYQVDPGAAQRARQSRGGSGGSGNAPSGSAPSTQPAPGQTEPTPGQPGQPGQRGGGAAPIPPRRVELRNLSTGAVRSWEEIGTFAFAATSSHLVLRRRGGEAAAPAGRRGGGMPPQAPAAPGSTPAPTGPRGQDAVLLDLKTGRFQLLGSVADYAFNRSGALLAYTVDAAVKDGNGLFVFDARNGRVTPLDNDAKNYNRLAWNDEGTALAVLKGTEVEKMRERDNVLIAFPDVPALLKDGAPAPEAGPSRPGQGRGLSERLGRERPGRPRVERRREARLFRDQGTGPRAGHDPQVHGRSGQCGRLEHQRRPGPVSPDGPGRAGPQLHLPGGLRCRGREVRQARRRDDARARRRPGRRVGRRPRHAGLPARREGPPGRGLLPGQHVHGRADAHRQGPAHRPLRLRHPSARHPFPLLEGRDDRGLRLRRRTGLGPRRREGQFHRHRIRPSRGQAVLRRSRATRATAKASSSTTATTSGSSPSTVPRPGT